VFCGQKEGARCQQFSRGRAGKNDTLHLRLTNCSWRCGRQLASSCTQVAQGSERVYRRCTGREKHNANIDVISTGCVIVGLTRSETPARLDWPDRGIGRPDSLPLTTFDGESGSAPRLTPGARDFWRTRRRASFYCDLDLLADRR